MKLPTKQEQYAYEIGMRIALVLVGAILGVCLGWTFAQCMRAVAHMPAPGSE
jgi:hypothetical protein